MKNVTTDPRAEWTVEPSGNKEIITFFGHQFAVRLVHRGPKDSHVCFELLTEDDDNWFPVRGCGASSFWMPDMQRVLRAAQKWLKQNGKPDMYKNVQYGYKI